MPEMKSLTLNDKTYDCFVDSVARSQVEATAVVDSASGETIALSNASNYKLTGLRIFGRTTQDGVPTPDAPVELVSVGDGGSITVDVTGNREAQNMTVATLNGLPGVPVADGGNYTDANSQQWICDEIDFARGVYVQRNGRKVFDGTENWGYGGDYFALAYSIIGGKTKGEAYCSHFTTGLSSVSGHYFSGSNGFGFYHTSASLTDWKAFLSGQYASGKPVELVYILATPIETPLSAEEIAAYSALHTYRDNTTVSNDASAHMELEYVMDAKKYIDSRISAGIQAATVE